MPRFWWLTYRKAGRLVGVVIVEAPSLIHARLMTAVRGIDDGAPFAEGHELGTDLVELIPAAQIGRSFRERRLRSCWPGSMASLAGPTNDHPGAPTRCRAAMSSVTPTEALPYVYSRDSEAEAMQAKVLTKDEAQRMAVNFAPLPELLGKADRG